jgi:hypothetical protein
MATKRPIIGWLANNDWVVLLLCNDREMGGYIRAVSGQRLGIHVPAATDANATMTHIFSIWSVPECYKQWSSNPCGGGVEYLRRAPASSRRRRKGKSEIWDSKTWSRVPRDSDPRKTTLARTIRVYKKQTRSLGRDGAPQKQGRNCQRVINIRSWVPDGDRNQDLLFDWPSIAMLLWR